jgi:DNA polymerase-3 subunit epsilon
LRPKYYDIETTGLNKETDRIIEIAAYDPLNKKSFTSLVNPGIPIPEEATKIHSITNEMVANAPSFKEVSEKFIEFCTTDSVLIAHNNDSFDLHFLKNEFKRINIPLPPWNFIDSLKWARKYRKDLPKHSLQYLREIYEIEKNNAHRALDDVLTLEKVFSKMIDDLNFKTIFELLSKKEKMRMPFGKHRGKYLEEVPKNYVFWLSKNGAFDKRENEELKREFLKLGILAKI